MEMKLVVGQQTCVKKLHSNGRRQPSARVWWKSRSSVRMYKVCVCMLLVGFMPDNDLSLGFIVKSSKSYSNDHHMSGQRGSTRTS